jgi:hypothetical protein
LSAVARLLPACPCGLSGAGRCSVCASSGAGGSLLLAACHTQHILPAPPCPAPWCCPALQNGPAVEQPGGGRLLRGQALPGHCGHDWHQLHRRPPGHRWVCGWVGGWRAAGVGRHYDWAAGLRPFVSSQRASLVRHCTAWRLAAGFGNHLARPLMREKHRPDMSEEEATQLLHECLKVGWVHVVSSCCGHQHVPAPMLESLLSSPYSSIRSRLLHALPCPPALPSALPDGSTYSSCSLPPALCPACRCATTATRTASTSSSWLRSLRRG